MIDISWGELESIETPGPEPRGLAWDGTTLWISDEDSRKLFRINIETRRVQYSFDYNGIPAGMTWDGKNLWQTDAENRKIDRLTRRGKVLDSIELKHIESFSGLTFDGKYLWQADHSGIWYKVDPTVRKVENAYTWGQNVWGIAHDGEEFWYLDDTTPGLHKISQLLGMHTRSYRIEGLPRDMTWDGENFWIIDSAKQFIKKFTP